MRNRFLASVGLALAAMLFASTGARADNYTFNFSLPSSSEVNVTYSTPSGSNSFSGTSSQQTWAVPFTVTDNTNSSGSFVGFCIDLWHTVYNGDSTSTNPSFINVATNATQSNAGFPNNASSTNPSGNPFSGNLGNYLNYVGYVVSQLNSAGGPPFTAFTGPMGDANIAGAVQLLLWNMIDRNFNFTSVAGNTNLVNDYNTLVGLLTNSTASNSVTLKETDGSTVTVSLTGYLYNSTIWQTVTTNEILLVQPNANSYGPNGNVQNVITWGGPTPLTPGVAPEPSTLAIAGLGALAFLGYGLRKRVKV